MAKRGRRPHGRGRQAGQRRDKRQTQPARTYRRGPDALLADVRRRLATGEPVDFLAHVSTLLAALDPRAKNPFERAGSAESMTPAMLIESFAEVVLPETTALLAALAELVPDELTRTRARLAAAARPHRLPDWLARLGQDLMSYFGLGQSGVSQRGYQIMHAAGIQPASAYPSVRLGSPDLLVSARRRRIIDLRDHYHAALGEEP